MEVVLMVGGWIGSTIVSDVVNSLISYAKDLKNQLGLEAELSRLKKTLPKIQALLEAIGRGQIKDQNRAVEKWLWQFRDAVDEADDFMDEMGYHRLEEEIHGEQSTVSPAASRLERFKIKIKSAKTMFKRDVHQDPTLKRLKNIVKRLDDVAAEVGLFFELVKIVKQSPDVTSSRETSSLLTVETRVFGRVNEKEEVINKLLNSNPTSKKNYSILPIIGVGGIGKTTLAQFVYNDKIIDNHFDKKVWICVSNNFDVLSLTKKIYRRVFDVNHPTYNFDHLQRELSKFLESKNILLVLDDVWNDDDRESWGKLLAPFSSVKRGSRILLTTRMEKVVRMMRGAMEPIFLKGLSEQDYWEFFKDCAFRDEDPEHHNKLQDIGRKIVGKLKRSPLAAKTVGGILSTNLDDGHWETILHSEIWELKQGENDIMPVLRLSYQYLPSHLKPCLRFCSIFPQDYEFDKEKLIYMWMALGLLQEPINRNRRPEDIGDEYLKDLVRRSFFDFKSFGGCYVMHDLLHELAVFVSGGECLGIEERSEPILIPTSVRHLSINTSFALPPISEITKLKHLRTLLLLKLPDCDVHEMLKGLTSLRILESSNVEITGDCISSLKLLRYLTICQVPESVNKLYHLQFLHCTQFFGPPNELGPPDCINNLINLRCLSTPKSRRGIFSTGIGRLSSLQMLEKFTVEDNGNNLFELKNLRELRALCINYLEKVTEGQVVTEAKLNDKEHLQILTLCWSDEHRSNGSPEVDEQVLDALQPHSNLKELTVKNYMGRRSPDWMTLSLSKLVFLSLCKCKGWEDLSPLGNLPYLKFLQLFSMDSVKRVGGGAPGVGIFPSLQELHFEVMPALEEFAGGTSTTQWLPCLERLQISYCPRSRVFSNLPCGLKDVHIDSVRWAALPELWQGDNNNSLSMPSTSSLSSLKIMRCEGLVSLAEGLLLHPQLFTSLEKLSISFCEKLTHLPIGGFERFTSLKDLRLMGCPKLQRGLTAGKFLPPSLQFLSIYNCDVLDPLLNAPEDLNFLYNVVLRRCAIKSLPSKEVLAGWKSVKGLSINECSEMESLGGLQALSSLKSLAISGCSKLVAQAQMELAPTSSSSSSSLILDFLYIDDPALLCTVPLKSISARGVQIDFCDETRSSALDGWVWRNHTSLEKLLITNLSSPEFPLVDLQSLSSLEFLQIKCCNNLRSLPELPSSLKSLWLAIYPLELEERCLRDSGLEWPKIQHIPKVKIGCYNKEELTTVTQAEHRSRKRELEIQKGKRS